jgi:hypothetical protein
MKKEDTMKTIHETKINTGNNESLITKGIYLENGVYKWLTATRSGECKKLETAKRKIGIN